MDGGPTSSGGTGGSAQAPATATVGDASFSVRIVDAPLSITLRRGDTTLLVLDPQALSLGTVAALDDKANYDPTFMAMDRHEKDPDGLAFSAPSSARLVTSSATTATVALTYPGGTAQLVLEAKGTGSFRATLTPSVPNVAYFRLRPKIDAKEGLYGLGEAFDSVDNRGKIRPMQIESGAASEAGYTSTHVPVPFVTGTRGWGFFVECPYPGVFDAAAAAPDAIEATFGTGLGSKDGIVFHLFAADHPLDVAKRYYDATGYPRIPARWALGPWLWRDENESQAQVIGDIAAMRSLDLAHTGLWIDRPYASGVNTFDWNPKQFPDATAMIQKAHEQGLRVAIWHVPYVDEKDPATKALLDEVKQKGFLPSEVGLSLNKWGTLLDLTNPAAVAYWQGKLKAYTDQGVEGYKLDYAEDVVPGLAGVRNRWRFFDGSDERTMHSRYSLFYHRTYQETLPQEGSFLLCRHGTYGDQVNVSVIWPGDLDATFDKAGDKVSNGKESYTAVGGLPASVIAGLSLGPSGFPFYGADTGGYIHSPPDKELFARWFEQTALSTVMQIGNNASTVAWEKDPVTGFDDEMLGWYRTYTRLHLRLFPYEWTYAQSLRKDGRPIARPLGLAYPEIGVHPDDTYLFGDHLLVAPVLARGVTSREVVLPPGDWVHWWTGERFAGGKTITIAAPLGELPLFLRAGGIVPLLRPTIDAMAPTTVPSEVDSYATTPGVLYPRIVLGTASTFTLFDGAEVKQEKTASGFSVTTKDGAELAYGMQLEIVAAGKKPAGVTLDGAPLAEVAGEAALAGVAAGFAYEGGMGGRIVVKVPKGGHTVVGVDLAGFGGRGRIRDSGGIRERGRIRGRGRGRRRGRCLRSLSLSPTRWRSPTRWCSPTRWRSRTRWRSPTLGWATGQASRVSR